MKKDAEKKNALLDRLNTSVDKIKIHKRGTIEGEIQREAFRIRWGKRPEDL